MAKLCAVPRCVPALTANAADGLPAALVALLGRTGGSDAAPAYARIQALAALTHLCLSGYAARRAVLDGTDAAKALRLAAGRVPYDALAYPAAQLLGMSAPLPPR